MGSLHSRAGPGQVHRVVSCRTLKDTLNDIILTSGDAENFENVYLGMWGQRGKAARRKRRSERSRSLSCVGCGLGYKCQ